MYVSVLNKNLVSISALEDKGMKVSFMKGKVHTWPVGSPMRDAFTLGLRFEGSYRVIGRPLLALVHDTNHLRKLWYQRLDHLHYDALLKLKKFVSRIPYVQAHVMEHFLDVPVERRRGDHSPLARTR